MFYFDLFPYRLYKVEFVFWYREHQTHMNCNLATVPKRPKKAKNEHSNVEINGFRVVPERKRLHHVCSQPYSHTVLENQLIGTFQ